MPNKELIEKCLRDIPVPHCNYQANCTRVKQAIEVAIPLIAEEIKKELERKVRNWEATTFNDECDGKPPYSMTTLEVRTSWWLTFWKGYVGE